MSEDEQGAAVAICVSRQEARIQEEMELALSECTSPESTVLADAWCTDAVSTDKSFCLLHGSCWKAKLQQILNLARETIIPVQYVKEVGKTVCVCSKQRNLLLGRTMNIKPEILVDFFHFHQTLVPVADLRPILSALAQDLQPIPEHLSKSRLLHILYRALKCNDFSLFEKKDMFAHAPALVRKFTLDLPQEYLGLLFGARGKHLKALCQEFDANIKLEVPEKHRMGWNLMKAGLTVVLIFRERNYENLAQLQQKLQTMAAKIKLKRELHNIRVSKFYQQRYKRVCQARRRPYRRRPGPVPDSITMKENAADDFSKKSKHQRRHKGDRGPNKTKAPGVLEEGSSCLNCLAPHPRTIAKPSANASDEDEEADALKTEKADSGVKDGAMCKYHPGYIVERRQWKYCLEWTCCHLVVSSKDYSVQQESHKNTGCCMSTHIWRPSKRLSRKGPTKRCRQDSDLVAVNTRLKQMSTDTVGAVQLATDFHYL